MSGGFGRLYRGETTFNFVGRRRWGFGFSLALLLISLISMYTRGLNLGIDFEGGVAWEVPSANLTIDQARSVLDDNGIETADAKIQTLNGNTGQSIRIQVGEQSSEVQAKVQTDLATKAGVTTQDVSVAAVSSSWGRTITEKALRALFIFFGVVSLYIAWRFEWKMAFSAIVAMAHDVLLSVGIYSLTGFSVTPATVIAFLTILGFSLYDTIVVFDKVHENTKKYSSSRVSYGDITNISMNQVLMRSLNTSVAAILPVLSLLVVGSWILGVIALEDFALALLVGMLLGAYSSIYIATPLLAVLKQREPKYRQLISQLSLGPDMLRVAGITPTGTAVSSTTQTQTSVAPTLDATREKTTVTSALTHPPRPRKKRSRK
ncbi:MAG: protein translocase subunit SecF [Ilumatobacteraceae bacterium]